MAAKTATPTTPTATKSNGICRYHSSTTQNMLVTLPYSLVTYALSLSDVWRICKRHVQLSLSSPPYCLLTSLVASLLTYALSLTSLGTSLY